MGIIKSLRAIIVAAAMALALPLALSALAEERGEKWGAYAESADQSWGLAWNFPDELSAHDAAVRECKKRAKPIWGERHTCGGVWVFSTSVQKESYAERRYVTLRRKPHKCILVTQSLRDEYLKQGHMGDVTRAFWHSEGEARHAFENRHPSDSMIGGNLLHIECNEW